MPQMRAVRSGASVKWRPRRKASKKRGGSKTFSAAAVTRPFRIFTESPASPSTRARASTVIVLGGRALMGLARFPERLGGRVEGPVDPDEIGVGKARRLKDGDEGGR